MLAGKSCCSTHDAVSNYTLSRLCKSYDKLVSTSFLPTERQQTQLCLQDTRATKQICLQLHHACITEADLCDMNTVV